jgi:hypothetical protein
MTHQELLEIAEKNALNGHIGDLFGCTFRDGASMATVATAAIQYGLDKDLEFPKITENSAYRRAIRESVQGQKNDERSYMFVRLEDSKTKILHAVVSISVVQEAQAAGQIRTVEGEFVAGKGAQLHEETRIGFDKIKHNEKSYTTARELLVSENWNHPLCDKFLRIYEESCERYDANDLRLATDRALNGWHGFKLFSSKGVWFVPSINSEKVRSVKDFLMAVGCAPVLLPQANCVETLEALKTASLESFDGKMADLQTKLDNLINSSAKVRPASFEARLTEYDEIRAAVEVHAAFLGFEKDSLMSRLADAEKAVQDALVNLQRSRV